MNSKGSLLRNLMSKKARFTGRILPNCASFISIDAPIPSSAPHVLTNMNDDVIFSHELFTQTMSLRIIVFSLLLGKLHAKKAVEDSDKIETNDMQKHTHVFWRAFTV